MRGDDARKVCPDLSLVQVPVAHGKADLTLYRASGKQVTCACNTRTLVVTQMQELPTTCDNRSVHAHFLAQVMSSLNHHITCS
jgi:hypothetical protein